MKKFLVLITLSLLLFALAGCDLLTTFPTSATTTGTGTDTTSSETTSTTTLFDPRPAAIDAGIGRIEPQLPTAFVSNRTLPATTDPAITVEYSIDGTPIGMTLLYDAPAIDETVVLTVTLDLRRPRRRPHVFHRQAAGSRRLSELSQGTRFRRNRSADRRRAAGRGEVGFHDAGHFLQQCDRQLYDAVLAHLSRPFRLHVSDRRHSPRDYLARHLYGTDAIDRPRAHPEGILVALPPPRTAHPHQRRPGSRHQGFLHRRRRHPRRL
ncbi:MAG: hypothetical protein MZU79_01555 [Anaerotruncus sp.]|nr:hypothetical protein [Anaerotruncus sp.]